MKKSDRDAWTARLRDPASRQAWMELHSDKGDASCCLGHLALCLNTEFTTTRGGRDRQYELVYNVVGRDNGETLQKLNDIERMTLPQIAEWIEANISITD